MAFHLYFYNKWKYGLLGLIDFIGGLGAWIAKAIQKYSYFPPQKLGKNVMIL